MIDIDEPLAPWAGPGFWNDNDMLEVGNGMSEIEDRSHFALWCILASPLIAGACSIDAYVIVACLLVRALVLCVCACGHGHDGVVADTRRHALTDGHPNPYRTQAMMFVL